MSRAKPDFTPSPQVWNAYQVAAFLNISEETFRTRRPMLEAAGFPRYDTVMAGWYSGAIERWMDRRSGLVSSVNDEQAWLEVLNG